MINKTSFLLFHCVLQKTLLRVDDDNKNPRIVAIPITLTRMSVYLFICTQWVRVNCIHTSIKKTIIPKIPSDYLSSPIFNSVERKMWYAKRKTGLSAGNNHNPSSVTSTTENLRKKDLVRFNSHSLQCQQLSTFLETRCKMYVSDPYMVEQARKSMTTVFYISAPHHQHHHQRRRRRPVSDFQWCLIVKVELLW